MLKVKSKREGLAKLRARESVNAGSLEFRKRGLPTFAEIIDFQQGGLKHGFAKIFCLLFHHGKSKRCKPK